jgi:hypothetical protein
LANPHGGRTSRIRRLQPQYKGLPDRVGDGGKKERIDSAIWQILSVHCDVGHQLSAFLVSPEERAYGVQRGTVCVGELHIYPIEARMAGEKACRDTLTGG